MGACILLVLDAAYVAAAAEGGSNAVSACHCRQGLASSLRLAPHAGLAAACPRLGARRLPVATISYCAVGAV
jgi:hypothetical protein